MVTQQYQSSAAEPQTEYEDPTIVYPYEDDEPLAETDYQYVPLSETVSALRAHFIDRSDIYVAADMFVYYRMNVVEDRVAPDVFVAFGVSGNHKRNIWRTWREGGVVPAFVMEIASESTWRRDATEKRDIYARMGVTEYWRFDPIGEYFAPPLVGERLVYGEYQPIPVTQDEDGILRGRSAILGLDICVRPDLELRLYDPVSGVWLENLLEAKASRDAERAGRIAAEDAREAAEIARQAERAALQAAERRIRELEAQLQERDT